MYKYLFSFFILTLFTSVAFAQTRVTASVGIGYHYSPAGSSWTKGSYFDLQGIQHTGFVLIDYTMGEKSKGSIDFKVERHDKKISIPVDSVDRIILDTDTMVVSHSAMLSFPFLTEVIHKNSLKLYNMQEAKSYTALGAKDTWYYGPDKEHLTLLDKKNFITVMPQIMADNEGVVKNILNKQYRYSDIVDLISYYQTGREPWRDRDNEQ
jgi:hypothetical protein